MYHAGIVAAILNVLMQSIIENKYFTEEKKTSLKIKVMRQHLIPSGRLLAEGLLFSHSNNIER